MQTSMWYLATHIFDYWFCNEHRITVPCSNFYSCCFCDYSTSVENVSLLQQIICSYHTGEAIACMSKLHISRNVLQMCVFATTYLKFQQAHLINILEL